MHVYNTTHLLALGAVVPVGAGRDWGKSRIRTVLPHVGLGLGVACVGGSLAAAAGRIGGIQDRHRDGWIDVAVLLGHGGGGGDVVGGGDGGCSGGGLGEITDTGKYAAYILRSYTTYICIVCKLTSREPYEGY